MGDQKPNFSYYQIGGFRPNVTLLGCSTTFFLLIICTYSIRRESRGLQYDIRKLAEAIVGESTVDLVLGTRF
jgi:hypothetical protein